MHLMTDSSETKTHLGGDTRGSPTPVPPPRTRSFCPTPAIFRDPLGSGSSHGRRAAAWSGTTPPTCPRPRRRPRCILPPAPAAPRRRFPRIRADALLATHPPPTPLPRPPPRPSTPRPRSPLRHRRAARTPSGRGEAWPPSRDPHRLTTGAARTHRGLRPTQAWLLLGAAPAQRHLLRTLTQLLGPPCEMGMTACRRLSLPLCRRLLVRNRGHNRRDVSRAPAEQRLLSRSLGRAPRAGARCICKETAAHWPAGGGACGARPIKCRPGERGAVGGGGARLLWVILRSRRRLDLAGALAGRGWSPWGGERRGGQAAMAAAEGSWAGGVAREDQGRPGCPR